MLEASSTIRRSFAYLHTHATNISALINSPHINCITILDMRAQCYMGATLIWINRPHISPIRFGSNIVRRYTNNHRTRPFRVSHNLSISNGLTEICSNRETKPIAGLIREPIQTILIADRNPVTENPP
jgi:hypothetical protein